MEVTPILLDTNAYAAFKQGDPETISIIQQSPVIALNTVVLGELLAGFSFGSREDVNRRELAQFLDSPRVVILPLDRGTADRYAAIYSTLRRAATPIPTNGMWIAASAIQHSFTLYSFDQHFHAIVGLQVGGSLSEF